MPDPDLADEVQRQLFMRSLGGSLRRAMASTMLTHQMHRRFYAPEETLFVAGSPASEIFFVGSGEVELRAEGEDPWHLSPPSVIGVIDALHNRLRNRTAVAVTDVQTLVLSVEDWLDAIEENFELARDNLMRVADDLAHLELEVGPSGAFPTPTPATEPTVGLSLVERVLLLRGTDAFAGATVQALTRLAEVSHEVELRAGKTLYREGDNDPTIFVVASGTVEITRAAPDLLARFGAGQMVAGAAGVGVRVPTHTAVAVTDVVLLGIFREDFFDIMEDFFDVTRSVMAGMSTERERVMKARAEQRSGRPSAGPAPR